MANIINKGIRAKVVASGGMFVVGSTYSCTLYKDVKKQDGMVTANAVAELFNGKKRCVFVFEPEQTKKLEAGTCNLEIYDTNTFDRMSYVDKYATVRATSLSS